MKVWKTYLFFSDHDQGSPYLIDTIESEGQWWLVGSWLQSNATGERTPERIVLLNTLRYQEVEEETHRFVLNNAIPKSVLEGEAQEGYVVATYQVLDDTQAPTDNQTH